MVGLATDFCVRATAIDARKFNLETIVIVSSFDVAMTYLANSLDGTEGRCTRSISCERGGSIE